MAVPPQWRTRRLPSPRMFWHKRVIVKGSSMSPALSSGDKIRVDLFAYLFKRPARGDVVVFRAPDDSERFDIKRVVGLPGETVQSDDGRSLTLPMNLYFVAGDNRTQSTDSRAYGPVPRSAIIGKALL